MECAAAGQNHKHKPRDGAAGTHRGGGVQGVQVRLSGPQQAGPVSSDQLTSKVEEPLLAGSICRKATYTCPDARRSSEFCVRVL